MVCGSATDLLHGLGELISTRSKYITFFFLYSIKPKELSFFIYSF